MPFVAAFVKRLQRAGHDLVAARSLRGLLGEAKYTQQGLFHTYTLAKSPQIVSRRTK